MIIDIAKAENGVTASELIDQTQMAESTLYKHINTLVDEGYLEKREGAYFPGLEFFHIGEHVKKNSYKYALIKEATEELRATISTNRLCDPFSVLLVSQSSIHCGIHAFSRRHEEERSRE